MNYTNPTATDNCPGVGVAMHSGMASGSAFPKGQTTVTWKATDAAGLTKTCTFRITVNDTEAPTISCPGSQSLNTDADLCSAVATYTTPTAADNCTPPTVVKTSGLASGSSFPKGSSTVVWRATDGAGLIKTCSFTVTVTDVQLPTINCPANIAVTAPSGQCNTVVSYTDPTAADNCTVQSTYLLSGPASGALFTQGLTTVVWRAVDNSGLSATCAFTVTVGCGTGGNGSTAFTPMGQKSNFIGVNASFPDGVNAVLPVLTLAPNPATTEVQILTQNLGEKGGELTVYDAQGCMVWQRRFGSETLTSGTVTLDVSEKIYLRRVLRDAASRRKKR